MKESLAMDILLTIIFFLSLAFSPFLLVRWKAAKTGENFISIWGGMFAFIAWTPTEAIVIHRNGRVRAVIGSDMLGGTTIISPILGDRLFARFDTALRSFNWKEEVRTKEILACTVAASVWWKISNVEKIISTAGSSIHLDQENSKIGYLSTIEARLKILTDSTIRGKVAQAELLRFLDQSNRKGLDSDKNISNTQGLAELSASLSKDLTEVLSSSSEEYGILINRVEIQRIEFSKDIENKLREFWMSYLKPAQAEQESMANSIHENRKLDLLSREVELLGNSTISVREIVKHLPDNSELTIQELLEAAVNSRVNPSKIIPPESISLTQSIGE